jgi:hypothetical protein
MTIVLIDADSIIGKKFHRLTVVSRAERKWDISQRFWNCVCDCGKEVVTTTSHLTSGHTKSCGCNRVKSLVNERGEYSVGSGYIRKQGSKKHLHTLIAEQAIGRELKGEERVHHIDYNRSNNAHTNLVICPNQKYHLLLHARQLILENGGHPDTHAWCGYHQKVHLKKEFSTNSGHHNGLHGVCRHATNTYRKEKGLNKSKFNWKSRLAQQYLRIKRKYTKRPICWC